MIFIIPLPIPVTRPEVELIEASNVLVLCHIPPGVGSVRVVVAATQRVAAPVMGSGWGLMVMVLVL